jgi:hypothetical protein
LSSQFGQDVNKLFGGLKHTWGSLFAIKVMFVAVYKPTATLLCSEMQAKLFSSIGR